jgi:biotin-(acetyl-CoA carboxylase) ligase
VLIERREGVALIGIGINVHQTEPDIAAAGLPHATSLRILGGRTNRLMLAIDLITALSGWLRTDDQTVRAHWAQHDAMLGTRRAFVVGGVRVEGEVTALDPVGSITVGSRSVPVEHAVTESA